MNKKDMYDICHEAGSMHDYAAEDDPKRLAFKFARYKHTAKMLVGYNTILEVGCADGYASRIIRQHCDKLIAIDTDERSILEAKQKMSSKWPIDFRVGNIRSVMDKHFDAGFALDVLEHIEPGKEESEFLGRFSTLCPVAVIGMPSLESQVYASRLSREGHVNCQSGEQLRLTLKKYWNHTFLYSLNDEALGTGYLPMAHYLLALCVS